MPEIKPNEKATHTLKLMGYPETAVRLMNAGRNEDGTYFYTVIPGIKSKLYQDGKHVITNVPEARLTPITSKPRRELQADARALAAGYIQGCLEAGSVTYYCEKNGLTDLDDEYLVNELRYIISELLDR